MADFASSVMWDAKDHQALVLDLGGGVSKVGFAGEDVPSGVISSSIGRRLLPESSRPDDPVTYIGDAGNQTLRRQLHFNYPIQHGIVTDWDDMELLLRHTFDKELRVDPAKHNVLMSEPTLNPMGNKEKMAQIMFEKFQVSGLRTNPCPILSVYCMGRVSAIALDVGDGVSSVMPVYEGSTFPAAFCRQDFAGRDITNYFAKLLNQKGYQFTTSEDYEIVRSLKDVSAYVAEDYQVEMHTKRPINYTLPDGNTLSVTDEHLRCAEILFQPGIVGKKLRSLPEMIHDSLMESSIDARADLCANIILTGGSSMMPGFASRMENELRKVIPPAKRVRILSSPERMYAAWIGGSILASLSSFPSDCVTKQRYEEYGPCVIYRCSLP